MRGAARQAGNSSARIVGYHVSNLVHVRASAVDALGKLVDAAVTAGANVVRNIHSTLDDPARAEAEAEAGQLEVTISLEARYAIEP